MAHIALFHSVYGLRAVEHAAADRFRAAGHEVVTPDLYAGAIATTIDGGFALKDRIGWEVIVERARDAVGRMSAGTVLAGVSMGAGVVGELLADRRDTAGLLLLHGITEIPASARTALPVQLHVADPDMFAPPAAVADWEKAAKSVGAAVQVFTYPGVGHFYTDASLRDHDAEAADRTWRRSLDFLRHL
ncbi:dienelactone hydrolase family protein [Nonomuraea aurantiaca]|uniref:dienelactone hydrolase family protein n=1 Tax=Nonomuraea aurantiaca TaxID=2878562 RepID=UPI001CDA28B4|nr:dienelactone hydrolase family protein [Nonomuraea aurantiaca]MCA2228116.1 dienelactone hydrolase family protein [Nonomuraea aurantiaca]